MACPLEEYRINEICVVSVTGELDDGTSIGILYLYYIRPDEALNMACPLEEYRINEICVVSVTGKLDYWYIILILYTARRGPEHGLPPGGVQDQRDLCRQCYR